MSWGRPSLITHHSSLITSQLLSRQTENRNPRLLREQLLDGAQALPEEVDVLVRQGDEHHVVDAWKGGIAHLAAGAAGAEGVEELGPALHRRLVQHLADVFLGASVV